MSEQYTSFPRPRKDLTAIEQLAWLGLGIMLNIGCTRADTLFMADSCKLSREICKSLMLCGGAKMFDARIPDRHDSRTTTQYILLVIQAGNVIMKA